MGDKYIIEIEENSCHALPDDVVYRAKNLPETRCYFLKSELKKLEKYDPEEEYDRGYEQGFEAGQHEATSIEFEKGYEKGLDDTWEATKKIISTDDSALSWTELEKIFGTYNIDDILEGVTPAEAIAKIEAYYSVFSIEEKAKAEAEIRVGDEVELISDGTKGVVYEVVPGQVNGFYIAGRLVHFCWRTEDVKKTNRRFPEIAELLKKMKEVEEK